MTYLKMLIAKPAINLEKEKTYELDEEQPIVGNDWKVKVPKKQRGKFQYVLVYGDEGELVE